MSISVRGAVFPIAFMLHNFKVYPGISGESLEGTSGNFSFQKQLQLPFSYPLEKIAFA
jgi:hypothetical protein